MKLDRQQLVDMILSCDVSISALENQLRNLKKQQADYEQQLYTQLENEDLQGFVTEDGKAIKRIDKLFVTTRKPDQQKWFEWLCDIGRGDLIKTDFNKTSLNSLIRKIIKGDVPYPMPEFLNIENDVFFSHRIEIKLGNKSLRKAAKEFGEEQE